MKVVRSLDGRIDRGHHGNHLVQRESHGRCIKGRVINALQKQANRVRMGTLTANDAIAARRVFPPFCKLPTLGLQTMQLR